MSPEIAIRFEVLHVPDCPNLAPMLDRLHEVTAAPVRTREITTDADAAAFGMAGSPTLLINGVDPFRAPGDCGCAVACRLYRDHEGRVVPAPSVGQLRRAIATAVRITVTTAAGRARWERGPAAARVNAYPARAGTKKVTAQAS
ncbi:hypothetical protein [Jiangella muralis]|uniref:hypothetical protein n=1 Tax=Jiangella muralis TaxID=702383 RepID=UPI00069DBEE3|nr:hypothetical protein [Jiangella muralis]